LLLFVHVEQSKRRRAILSVWAHAWSHTDGGCVLSRCLFEWVCQCGGSSQCAKERTHKHIHENTPNRATPLAQHHSQCDQSLFTSQWASQKHNQSLVTSVPHGQSSPPHLQSKPTSRPHSFPQTHHIYLTISHWFNCFENHCVMVYVLNTCVAVMDTF